jgi:hypothetical protein
VSGPYFAPTILMEKNEILTEKGASLSLQKNKVALEEGTA